MALYIPHSIFHLVRLLYVRPETFGPYYVYVYMYKERERVREMNILQQLILLNRLINAYNMVCIALH